jgi:ABC-type sugar transport system substrate-binding protein
MKSRLSKRSLWVVAAFVCVLAVSVAGATAANRPVTKGPVNKGLKKGLKVFVIPKNLGNSYFTTADSVKTGGALAALKQLGEQGSETSGNAATAAAQIPAIRAAISKGANALVVSATDPKAICPTLKQAMARKITVVTYDADAPSCRTLFINQADTAAIGTSEVDLLAKQIHSKGKFAIVSAAASAPNQNAWIGFMKRQLKKYPKMQLVSTVYGNDDPTKSTQVTQGLLQRYPDLKGIIAPTTVGAAQVGQGHRHRPRHAGGHEEVRSQRYGPGVRAVEPGRPRLSGGAGRRPARLRRDHQRQGSVVQGRQARQVHGRRGQHRPARPPVRVQQVQRRPVPLLSR